ncbi:MAG: hypothetical protein JOZ37_14520 [Actinobacteria bacterium]|nr:hypothetical protein [Actinomycetota bacterium]MBV9665177.1 hypothetical protein [Actinomycetota bacterium]
MNDHTHDTGPTVLPDADAGAPDGDQPTVLDLELQALAYEAALRYGARQVPKPLVEFLRPKG